MEIRTKDILLLSNRLKKVQKIFSNFMLITIMSWIIFFVIMTIGFYLAITNKLIFARSIAFNNGKLNESIKVLGERSCNIYTIAEDDYKKLKHDAYLNKFTALLLDQYHGHHPASFYEIKDILIAVDKYVKIYFPEGTFTSDDLLAIAKYESDFDLNCIGKAGEHGIFQILEWELAAQQIKKDKNKILDPYVNTEAGCLVLKQKYDQFRDFKIAIIAYNGICKSEDGSISEIYYKRFLEAKQFIISIKNKASK